MKKNQNFETRSHNFEKKKKHQHFKISKSSLKHQQIQHVHNFQNFIFSKSCQGCLIIPQTHMLIGVRGGLWGFFTCFQHFSKTHVFLVVDICFNAPIKILSRDGRIRAIRSPRSNARSRDPKVPEFQGGCYIFKKEKSETPTFCVVVFGRVAVH